MPDKNLTTFRVFADTGVQTIKVDVPVRWTGAERPNGWQYCYTAVEDGARLLPFAQWQLLDDDFYLAIDTTLGETKYGHIADEGTLVEREFVEIAKLASPDGTPIPALAQVRVEVELVAGGHLGGAKAAHLVIDFGNSRSGALLMELEGEPISRMKMLPIKLLNRYQLGESEQWFSSRTCWAAPPYRPPQEVRVAVVEHFQNQERRWFRFGGRGEPEIGAVVEHVMQPRLFDDISMARMGKEVEQIGQLISGNALTGVSSPKRYLWSDDARWMEQRLWAMLTPFDEGKPRKYCGPLQGPLLSYIPHNDTDELVERFHDDSFDPEIAPTVPTLDPDTNAVQQHVPRTLMVAAIYELLCQGYTYANSPAHRHDAGDADRVRYIESVTFCHPSGMIAEERERLRKQAMKAIRIFNHTLGKQQRRPELVLDFDEATAVQLAYIWGELETIGHDPRTWFAVMGRLRESASPTVAEEAAEQDVAPLEDAEDHRADLDDIDDMPPPLSPMPTPEPARREDDDEDWDLDDGLGMGMGMGMGTGATADDDHDIDHIDDTEDIVDLDAGASVATAALDFGDLDEDNANAAFGSFDRGQTPQEVRIASIDIGGGTSDLMIATYSYDMVAGIELHGKMIHRDGISIAGDRLVEKVLEHVVVPKLAQAIGLSAQATLDLFGPETAVNRSFRVERVTWMNQMLLPLAHKYFDCASRGDERTVITHYSTALDSEQLVDEDVLKSFINVLQSGQVPSLQGGMYNIESPMDLRYSPKVFNPIVKKVFLSLIKDFCARIIEHQVDIVLLAGQPTKIGYLQDLVRNYLSLPASRVIPMYRHYAGLWYPYQDSKDAGVITDPKSAVVTGAAVGYATKHIRRAQIRFSMKETLQRQRFFWGQLVGSHIRKPHIWFRPESEDVQVVPVKDVSTIIGRKQFEEEGAESIPIYLLDVECERGDDIDLRVRVRRQPKELDPSEEELVIDSVRGKIGQRDARESDLQLKIWTLREQQRFFLDEGGLYDIRVKRN